MMSNFDSDSDFYSAEPLRNPEYGDSHVSWGNLAVHGTPVNDPFNKPYYYDLFAPGLVLSGGELIELVPEVSDYSGRGAFCTSGPSICPPSPKEVSTYYPTPVSHTYLSPMSAPSISPPPVSTPQSILAPTPSSLLDDTRTPPNISRQPSQLRRYVKSSKFIISMS